MLVYREDERRCEGAEALRRVVAVAEAASRTPDADSALDLLIELGELEAAIVDRLFPERDGIHGVERLLRAASLAAGHAVIAGSDAQSSSLHVRSVLEQLSRLRPDSLPRELTLRVSEGYAYYALHPRMYAASAARFAQDHLPSHAVCIGIRSIGTSLSAIVAAELQRRGVTVDLYSVRPRGHPFERSLLLRSDLVAALHQAPSGSYYLVVDEGPGLSGSSFASVARALAPLGVEDSRIIFFPSWDADGAAFKSDDARRVWLRHQRYAVVRPEVTRGIDWSAGAWRRDVLGNDETRWPAVQPQHEVEKRWRRDEAIIVRFAGLGRYGRAKLARADALAAHGLGPPPRGLRDGYLSLEFVAGTASRRVSPAHCDAIATHAAFLTRTFPADRSPSVEQLDRMIATNLGDSPGACAQSPTLVEARAAVAAAPATLIDGRMMLHEWIECTEGRLVKVDALDHHADHFFPGVQDAAWDLAAAAFECGMAAAHRERLVARYIALSGDRDVAARLPFYDIAYPAFRLGYATLASESVADARERARFERVIARCRAWLTSPSAP